MNKQPKNQKQNHKSLFSYKNHTADTLKEFNVNTDPEICALVVLYKRISETFKIWQKCKKMLKLTHSWCKKLGLFYLAQKC